MITIRNLFFMATLAAAARLCVANGFGSRVRRTTAPLRRFGRGASSWSSRVWTGRASRRSACRPRRSHRWRWRQVPVPPRTGVCHRCKLLVEGLRAKGRKAELRRFPERSTGIGQLIDRYLKREIELDDRAVHLLFSANRWDEAAKIRAALESGVDVVCDRYAFSGVAFSAAKPSIDDLDWCKAPDAGLPKPDVVLFLEIPPEKAEARGGFGDERYEESDMQKRVAANFKDLRGPNWRIIDAAREIKEVQTDIESLTLAAAEAAKDAPIAALWD